MYFAMLGTLLMAFSYLDCFNQESVEVVTEQQEVQKMKEEVKRMFAVAAPNPSETLELIDTIQRLGLDYHFEDQISEKLRENKKISLDKYNSDLHIISLWFRLLRQEGYNVSSGTYLHIHTTPFQVFIQNYRQIIQILLLNVLMHSVFLGLIFQ